MDQSCKNCVTESGGTIVMAGHGEVWAPGGQGVLNDTEVGGPIL